MKNFLSYVLLLNSKQIIDARLSDDGNSCTGMDSRRPVGIPSCGSRSQINVPPCSLPAAKTRGREGDQRQVNIAPCAGAKQRPKLG